jgi:glutathione S-transferase
MAPSYKVTYFPTKGWAEPIRFILSYGNLDFEDIRVPYEEWPAQKAQAPFGFLPMLEHEGKKAHQSSAICRYLAKQVNLAGKDDWEDLEIDAAVDSIKDFGLSKSNVLFVTTSWKSSVVELNAVRTEIDEAKRKEKMEQIIKEVLPDNFGRLEKFAQRNNGYLAVGRLTWADLFFVSLLKNVEQIAGVDVLKNHPNLLNLKKKVLELPGIKKWVEKRPEDIPRPTK